MQSNYFTDAWRLTVGTRIFWLLGFILTSFGAGWLAGPSPGPPPTASQGPESISGFEPALIEKLISTLAGNRPELILVLIITALLFGFIYMFIALVSEGALVFGVANRSKEQEIKFLSLFSRGLDFLPRLFGYNALLFLTYLLSITGLILLIILNVILIGISPFFTLPLLVIFFLFIVWFMFISIVTNYTKRFIVIERTPVFRSISSAIKLLFERKTEAVKLYFSTLAVYIVAQIFFGIVTVILYIPFAMAGADTARKAALVLLVLLPVVFLLRFVGGIVTAFLSAAWTLGFLEAKDKNELPVILEEQAGGA